MGDDIYLLDVVSEYWYAFLMASVFCCKFGDVCWRLTVNCHVCVIVEAGLVDEHSIVRPREARNEDLLAVHSKSYLENLKVRLLLCLLIYKHFSE